MQLKLGYDHVCKIGYIHILRCPLETLNNVLENRIGVISSRMKFVLIFVSKIIILSDTTSVTETDYLKAKSKNR